jgi:ribosomal subunit interface protein
MDIHTTARHCELTDDDRTFIHERLDKLERFARDIQDVRVVITAEGYRYIAETTVRLKHRDLALREEATDPRRAIDGAAHRLELQLRRIHDRRIDRRREVNGDGSNSSGAGDTASDELPDAEGA